MPLRIRLASVNYNFNHTIIQSFNLYESGFERTPCISNCQSIVRTSNKILICPSCSGVCMCCECLRIPYERVSQLTQQNHSYLIHEELIILSISNSITIFFFCSSNDYMLCASPESLCDQKPKPQCGMATCLCVLNCNSRFMDL